VVRDGSTLFHKFGEVLTDVEPSYLPGDTASAIFVGANPRNDLRLERTYAAVERKLENGEGDGEGGGGDWEVVRDDSDWGLIFTWRRTSEMLGTSEATVTWEIEDWTAPGVYRLRYFGDWKALGGSITAFEGSSKEFRVG
jgi:neutral ceramidase